MSVIYKPKGKAGEYGDLAVNLFNGCDHGCTYCYAPAVTRASKEQFANPVPRKNIIEKIKKEIHKHVGKQIFLCFTCDPYCHAEQETQLTRQAIKAIHEGGAFVNILTKGGLRSTRDFDLLGDGDSYGATLTLYGSDESREFEPYAAPPFERCTALGGAHSLGIKTWASLEPVLSPGRALALIKTTQFCVDLYKIGKWNYDERAKDIDWAKFLVDVEGLLNALGKDYYIKADLEAYRGDGS